VRSLVWVAGGLGIAGALALRALRRQPQAVRPEAPLGHDPRAEELRPALDALARWGAAGMRETREGEVVTDASLVGSLRVAGQGSTPPRRRGPVTYEVRVGPAIAHATVIRGEITVEPGGYPAPDLVVVAGPAFRDVLAGVLDPDAALEAGAVELIGDHALLADFTATFTVPYSDALLP